MIIASSTVGFTGAYCCAFCGCPVVWTKYHAYLTSMGEFAVFPENSDDMDTDDNTDFYPLHFECAKRIAKVAPVYVTEDSRTYTRV